MPTDGELRPEERRALERARRAYRRDNVLIGGAVQGGAPLVFWFILKYWRPFLVAVAAALIASFVGGNNGTINLVTAAGAFAVSLTVFMLLERRRRALGRLSLSEKMGCLWDEHVEADRDSPLLTSRPVAVLLAIVIFTLGVGVPLVVGVLFPEALGSERWSTAGRLAGSAVGGFQTVGGLSVLVLLYGTLVRAPFASSDPKTGRYPRRTSRALNLSVFGLSGVVIAALFFASPAPTTAQRAADRARAAAAKAAEDRTQNVHAIGARAADGEFVYSVRSIREVAGLPHLTPRAGDTLVVADVSVTNHSDVALPPFPFRGYGAFLVDSTGERYATDHSHYTLASFVPAHATRSQELVFELPTSRAVNGLVLWDVTDKTDRDGATYVYFRAGSAPAVRDLGPTADGR